MFGELFGGAYPSAEVEAIEGLQAIQTGVYYSNEIQFIAFDVRISTDENGSKKSLYLDFSDIFDLAKVVLEH